MTPSSRSPIVHGQPGWFGKLACLGDFASRRLDDAARSAWDGWLSQSTATLRSDLGDAWLDRYLQAPVWCWLQSPASDAQPWTAGTWMPSVDRSGRYFPLVIVAPLARMPAELNDWLALEAALRRMSQASLATLAADASVDRFDAALAALVGDAERPSIEPSVTSWFLGHFAANLRDASLWWTEGGDGARVEARWPNEASFLIDHATTTRT
jgi:type VI secretion system protein ImpM